MLSVDDCTVTVHYNQRGPTAGHKNNVRASQTADIIVLPSAGTPRDLTDGVENQDPSGEGEVHVPPDVGAVQLSKH